MFKIFNKSKKSSGTTKRLKKTTSAINGKAKSNGKNVLSSGQNMNNAAEKLETTIRHLNKGKIANSKPPSLDKRNLIKRALEIQKVQSKLLDDLDTDTRQRLKAMALELMVFKKRN